ncbi:hypothetical protein QWZ04_23445 [Vibrio tapetis subsp. quintayensis]|uniref:hypothetical protein n=1 Tax=Vibrio tapetis TaxID=52443 RepID=UPI0025B5A8DC|nr:hypothetical protein [Vibrio tapetis]MDN3683260.1 hypothetical protein [Vibrio tapetis subsp. quintayensis]
MRKRLSLLLIVAIAGCSSPQYDEAVKHNDKVHQTITEKTTYIPPPKISRITKPPQVFSPVEPPSNTQWLKEKLTVNVSDMPLSVVMEEVMVGVKIPIYFGENADPNKRVTLNFSNTRENVLNLLSREAGFGIEFINQRLEVTETVTKTFFINLPTGTQNGQLGSEGGGSSDKEDKAKTQGQYLNISYSSVEVIAEIAANIVTVLGGEENAEKAVSTSANMSAITVTTTPDKMQEVEKIVERYQEQLTKQVVLDVRVIEFRSNLGTERGINWNLVYKSGGETLKFFVPGTNLVSQQAGYGFAFQGSGKWSGSEALIKVLEKQGSVSTETPITALLLNNQPARITQQSIVPYLYSTSSESSEGVVSASVTRKEEVEGVDFMASANVQSEHVWLRLSGQLQKITKKRTEKVAQLELGFLDKQKSEITFANKLRYGQTYVIASVKQSSKTAEQNKSFWTTLFGGTGSEDLTTETLVLLTPRKAY